MSKLESVKFYETRPVNIQALEYNGENCVQILTWMGVDCPAEIQVTDRPIIRTLEGDMTASPGDFIIKGLRGEFYPCKPDIFHQKYKEISPRSGDADGRERE